MHGIYVPVIQAYLLRSTIRLAVCYNNRHVLIFGFPKSILYAIARQKTKCFAIELMAKYFRINDREMMEETYEFSSTSISRSFD